MDKINEKELGNIKVLDEVIETTAYETVLNVEGVAGMSSNISGISNIIGKGNQKGIRITSTDKDVSIDVYVLLEYGVKIPDVAWNIQEEVKRTVEETTNLLVNAVHIHVQGVIHKRNNEQNIEKTL